MIAEAMQKGGYTTGGIVSNINLAPSFGFDQGYDEYHYLAPDYLAGAKESSSKLILYQIGRNVWFKLRPGLRVGDFYQDAATVNGVAFDFLERHRASRFFLFLHYMDPHDPYFEHPYNGKAIARVANPNPSPALAAEMQRLYTGEVHYVDEHFAELLAKLRELGLYDDTLIVLTGDHGEEFHEHGGFWHGLTLVRRADPRAAADQVAEGGARRAAVHARPSLAPHRRGADAARARRRPACPRRCRASISRRPRPSAPRRIACRSPRRTTRATCCARCAPRSGS